LVEPNQELFSKGTKQRIAVSLLEKDKSRVEKHRMDLEGKMRT
jgi:hypothetical protein